MPVYVYLLIECLMFVINQEKDMSLLVKDFVQAFGSMLSSLSLLYCLYIDKFITLFFRIKKERINSQRSLKNRSGAVVNRLPRITKE